MSKKQRKDMYQEITNTVVEALKNDTIPWEKPWRAGCSMKDMPRSVATGKVYRGVNIWLTAMADFDSPWWMTYKQCQDLGGNVKKGEKSTLLCFYKMIEIKDKKTKEVTDTYPMLKGFRVFNLEQCELPQEALDKLDTRLAKLGGDADAIVNENEVIENAQKLMDSYFKREKIEVLTGGDRAYYQPSKDRIQMPDMKHFVDSESYYATLFHEGIHSTGHKSRLAREDLAKVAHFGDEDYSREELTAELGASFLCGVTGIENKGLTDNRDDYIKGWLTKLENDPRAVVVASGKAMKASEFVLGDNYEQQAI